LKHNVLDTAQNYVQAGLSVLPVRADGSKSPAIPWKQYQEVLADGQTLKKWFSKDDCGIGIVCGRVSGGLEVLDFEADAPIKEWGELAKNQLGEDFLKPLPLVKTPSGGWHLYYRCPEIGGNQKLALELKNGTQKVLIETRAEGGYVLAPGSPPTCHPSGKPYKLLRGDLTKIPTISPEQRAVLLRAARALTQVPAKEVHVPKEYTDQGRPGDDFNRRSTWREILEPHGWKLVRTNGEIEYWRRPGKDDRGISATVGYAGTDLLHVFSSNAHPFESDTAYSKFGAYTLLNHGGDFQAAAKELAAKGYGDLKNRNQGEAQPKLSPNIPEIITEVFGSLTKDSDPATIEASLRQLAAKAKGLDAIGRVTLRGAAVKHLQGLKIPSPTVLIDASLGMVKEKVLDDKQGGRILFEDPEPWPEPVDGAALLNEIKTIFSSFLILPPHADVAATLWVAHTYCLDATDVSPILAITSPTKRCGKTRLLEMLALLVKNPLSTSNITSAALFRSVEKFSPTLLVDEADTFAKDEDGLRGVINSGWRRQTAYVTRCVGDDQEPRQFRTWGAKALAAIGKLPDTIRDRSIEIKMRRKTTGENIKPFRYKEVSSLTSSLRSKIARWALDHIEELRATEGEVPPQLNDRQQENWLPLLTIAQVAGDEWPELARKAALALSGAEAESENEEVEVILLRDIKDFFEQQEVDRVSSETLAKYLGELSEKPWAEWKHGKPITQRGLARLLERFEVKSKNLRIDAKIIKGYALNDFEDAFARYIPLIPPFQSATPLQSAPDVALRPKTDPLQGGYVADRKSGSNPHEYRVVAL
jgi:hypothetical protein